MSIRHLILPLLVTLGIAMSGCDGGGGSAVSPAVDAPNPGGAALETPVLAIAAGSEHSLALAADGTVWAWGRNDQGQVAAEKASGVSTPRQIPSLDTVVAVLGGGGHSLALKGDGSIWAWGDNTFGQLGALTEDSAAPLQIGGLVGVTAIAAGGSHGLAQQQDGTVRAWGGQ